MLKSSLCDYSDAYILGKGRITITDAGADAAARQADEKDKGVIFKNCASFINCKSRINNTEIHNAKDIDIVMQIYNLTELIIIIIIIIIQKHLEVYCNITKISQMIT